MDFNTQKLIEDEIILYDKKVLEYFKEKYLHYEKKIENILLEKISNFEDELNLNNEKYLKLDKNYSNNENNDLKIQLNIHKMYYNILSRFNYINKIYYSGFVNLTTGDISIILENEKEPINKSKIQELMSEQLISKSMLISINNDPMDRGITLENFNLFLDPRIEQMHVISGNQLIKFWKNRKVNVVDLKNKFELIFENFLYQYIYKEKKLNDFENLEILKMRDLSKNDKKFVFSLFHVNMNRQRIKKNKIIIENTFLYKLSYILLIDDLKEYDNLINKSIKKTFSEQLRNGNLTIENYNLEENLNNI